MDFRFWKRPRPAHSKIEGALDFEIFRSHFYRGPTDSGFTPIEVQKLLHPAPQKIQNTLNAAPIVT